MVSDETLESEWGTSPTYSITELVDVINDVLDRSFEDGFWVWGEISGLSVKNRHTYFTLIEQDENGKNKAQLNINLWSGDMIKLRPVLAKSGLELVNGIKVRIFGSLNFYGKMGKLSMIMKAIDPRYTLGEIALARDELVRRLKESGAYERNRRVEISPVPLRVGVVTSGTSAAWADFRNQMTNSALGFHLLLADVVVQGEQAVSAVTRAIDTLSRRDDLDVIVVIRGGGSKAELSTFDTQEIAMAISRCRFPVFTGIGHEIDTSVADEVAFERHKTPTACAVALIERVDAFVAKTESAWEAISRMGTQHIVDSTSRLNSLTREIAIHTRSAVDHAGERLIGRIERLHRRAPQLIADCTLALNNIAARVRLLDPQNVLARGWSITRNNGGQIVRSTAEVTFGDILTTTLIDGKIISTVNKEETR